MRDLRNALAELLNKTRFLFVRSTMISACVIVLILCAPLWERSLRHQDSLLKAPTAPGLLSRIGITLKRGDTLLALLTQHGIKPPSAHALIAKVRPLFNPRKLRPGNHLDLVVDPDNRTVQEMEVPLDEHIVRAKATAEGWTVEREAIPYAVITRVIRGNVSSNLFDDGIAADLSPEHILELAGIFEYDIDFYSDFQRGDDFSVLVEERQYNNGRRVPRKIRAAELEADGEIHSAFYFTLGPGRGFYYDKEGKQLRRAFLRAPLSYTRISSQYTLARSHPIFRILRPHRAIDYAAPSGTPVVAIGPGKVNFSGWQLGYGNLVEIVHPGGYASRYGHFSRIAPGIRRGVNVNAGEVIGFVGQTGHATGPHLHFEFLQGGQKINFLNLKIPRIDQLAGSDLDRFKIERDQTLARLQSQRPATTHAARDL